MNEAKPFDISKRAVWDAYRLVKANKGGAGVDGQSIQDLEVDLANNLYKIWNRLSSGSYFPPPVRRVEIPKANGGVRPLGIPTVRDRIAQTVIATALEIEVEPCFHPDSYGYRPGRSAIDAVGVARRRCWRHDWVIDLDVRAFFDSVDHDLMMRAVRKHTDCKWIILYVERWLKAPAKLPDGTLLERDRGTPQGGVISPLLANLFLHYAFDLWMARTFPDAPFERYADDALIHCKSQAQAHRIKEAVALRLAECGLELHPEKTKIVYCKDKQRQGQYPVTKFDFLGFRFQPRKAKSRAGGAFLGFIPAISDGAAKRIRQTIRDWRLHRQTPATIEGLAEVYNPIIRGWITYYGNFYRSKLGVILQQLDFALVRWAKRKYKSKASLAKATRWLRGLARRQPKLFAHWRLTMAATVGRQEPDESRGSRPVA